MTTRANDMSRSLAAFDQGSTLIAVIELSKESWLVAGLIPGVERQPKKKMEPDAEDLLRLLVRWRDEAVKGGRPITRIAVAYEAGRDGFWLARWLESHGIVRASPAAVSAPAKGRSAVSRPATRPPRRSVTPWASSCPASAAESRAE